MKPDAILCSDIHLRSTQPQCIKEDFLEIQYSQMKWLKDLQKKYDCPVLHAGDVFEKAENPSWLLSQALEFLPDKFYTCYGNHDLQFNNIKHRKKSSLYTLYKAGKINEIIDGSWGTRPKVHNFEIKGRKILILHEFVWYKEKPIFHNEDMCSASGVLKKYHFADLVLSGDNHQKFIIKSNERLNVNPGNFLVEKLSDTLAPSVYLYYTDTNTVEEVKVPFDTTLVTDIHLSSSKKRDKRLEAFISKLSEGIEVEFSFEENVKKLSSKVSHSTRELINEAMEDR